MIIRKALLEDIDDIMPIFYEAVEYLKNNNVNQWQNNSINKDKIIDDIKNEIGYVVFDEKIIAYFVILEKEEKTYINIDGKWLNDDPYYIIHRFCIKNEYKGKNIGSFIIDYCKKYAINNNIYNLRIDTHKDNKSMIRLIEKNNFVYCGIIVVLDNTLRLAYQLNLG